MKRILTAIYNTIKNQYPATVELHLSEVILRLCTIKDFSDLENRIEEAKKACNALVSFIINDVFLFYVII